MTRPVAEHLVLKDSTNVRGLSASASQDLQCWQLAIPCDYLICKRERHSSHERIWRYRTHLALNTGVSTSDPDEIAETSEPFRCPYGYRVQRLELLATVLRTGTPHALNSGNYESIFLSFIYEHISEYFAVIVSYFHPNIHSNRIPNPTLYR